MADSEDRTLAATDRRLQQAREQGQVPVSRELVTVSGLGVITLVVMMLAPALIASLKVQLTAMLTNPVTDPGLALRQAGLAILQIVLPIGGAVALAGSAAVMLQTGWLFHTEALMPDLSRLDPRRGLKRVFGLNNSIEAAKALLKVTIIGWAVWHVLSGALATTEQTLSYTTPAMLDRLTRDITHVLITVLACQGAIALFDVGWTRFRFNRQLRMSLEEVKEEQKQMDGDPRIKAKIKQIRFMRARRRMIAAVAKATVVVTNPTTTPSRYPMSAEAERLPKLSPRAWTKLRHASAKRRKSTACLWSPTRRSPEHCMHFRSMRRSQPSISKLSRSSSRSFGGSASRADPDRHDLPPLLTCGKARKSTATTRENDHGHRTCSERNHGRPAD